MRASEERFRGVFEQGSVGIALLDLESRFLRANPALCRFLGYEERELIGVSVIDVTCKDDTPATVSGLQGLYSADLPSLRMDKRYVRKDGTLRWGHVSATLIRDSAGEFIGGVSIVQDISARKQMEEELRLTQLSVDRAADLIHWTDREGHILYVSDSTCRRHGFSREELLALRVFDIDPLQTPETWQEHWLDLKAAGSRVFESLHVTRDGEVFPIEVTANHVECEGREYNFSFARDISERKRQEVERRQLIDGMNDTAFVIDFSGKFLEVNDRAVETLGYTRAELVSMGPPDLDPCLSAGDIAQLIEGMKQGGRQVFETQHRTKDGRIIPVEISSSPVSFRGEGAILAIARDLTERKQAAEALAVEKERLSLLNRAAVEISHCLTVSDVLRAGLRLVCETPTCDGGVIWMPDPAGRGRVMGSEGLEREGRRQLVRVLRSRRPLDETAPFAHALVVPLQSRGSTLGMMCLGSAPGTPPPARVGAELIEGIAALIGVALENACLYDQAQFLAHRDPVTGLLNNRGINAQLEEELKRSRHTGGSFAVVMMDLDNFKLFNDTYGHGCGDEVLQRVASVLAASVRRVDAVGRYGGDEFIALLRDTDAAGAARTIGRMQSRLREMGYIAEGDCAVPIFASCGVAEYPSDGRSISELLGIADANLYKSKRQGGDCVTTSACTSHSGATAQGFHQAVESFVTAVDGKDRYTRKHSDDVCALAVAVAAELGLSSEVQRSLRMAALLHDVGKIGVPDHILRKPGRLTDEEQAILKQHVSIGELIIKGIPDTEKVLSAVSSHHERFDGRGYPRGLKGDAIPLLGRILAATDAYSAMTTNRPYRNALTLEEARSELQQVSGSQLDPRVVTALLSVLTGRRAAVAGGLPLHRP